MRPRIQDDRLPKRAGADLKATEDPYRAEPARRARPAHVGRAAAWVVFVGGVAICGWRVARLHAETGYGDLAALRDSIVDVAGLAALIAVVLSVVGTACLAIWGLRRSRSGMRARNVVVVLLLAAGCGALAAAPIERHWPDAHGDDIGRISLADSVRHTVDSGMTDPWRRYMWSFPALSRSHERTRLPRPGAAARASSSMCSFHMVGYSDGPARHRDA